MFDSIKKCVEICEGVYSFVLISELEPDAMYIVKNAGTMVIGVSKGLKATKDLSLSIAGEESEQEDEESH